jgi:hypothetical protein
MTDDPSAPGRTGDDNPPGFEYGQRVITSAFRALAAHGEEINEAWPQIQGGTYTAAEAMQSWAKVAESYYGIFIEIMRGPLSMPRPAWMVIPYSKKKPPSPSISVRIDGTVPRGTPLSFTNFEAVGAAKSGRGILDGPPTGAGNRVQLVLRDSAIQKLGTYTDHVAFIFRQGTGRESPLVIVILRVMP